MVSISTILFVMIVTFNKISMGTNEYESFALFILGALSGSYIIVYLSRIISTKDNIIVRKIINLGVNSIDVLIWHLVVFRVGIAIQLLMNQESLHNIMDYYPIYNSTGWLLYLIIGIEGSIWIGQILRKVKENFLY